MLIWLGITVMSHDNICISELTKKYLNGLSESNINSILIHDTLSYKSLCLCKDLLKFALLCGVLYHDFGCGVSLLGT